MCFFYCDCAHRDLHVLTHSFPTRRSSDLYRRQSVSRRDTLSRPHARSCSIPPCALKTGDRGRCFVSGIDRPDRSEEHTSELQSLMRISYAVFCLKKKKKAQTPHTKLESCIHHDNKKLDEKVRQNTTT